MINKDDSKNVIWVAYCDLRADYEQLRQERDQLKVQANAIYESLSNAVYVGDLALQGLETPDDEDFSEWIVKAKRSLMGFDQLRQKAKDAQQ